MKKKGLCGVSNTELERWKQSKKDIEADIALLKKQRRSKRAKESAPISASTPFAPISTKGNEFNTQLRDLELRLEDVKAIIRRLEEAKT